MEDVRVDKLLLGIGAIGASVLVGGRRQAAKDAGRDDADELLLHLLVDVAGAGLDETLSTSCYKTVKFLAADDGGDNLDQISEFER